MTNVTINVTEFISTAQVKLWFMLNKNQRDQFNKNNQT